MSRPKYTNKQVNLCHAIINELQWREHAQPDTDFKEVLARLIELIAMDMVDDGEPHE